MRTIKIVISVFAFILYSCEEVLYEVDLSTDNVEILAPVDSAFLKEGVLNFNWKPVEDANEYTIQIAIPNFETATQIILDSTTANTSISKELNSNIYQWRVKALNTVSETPFTLQNLTVETDISLANVVLMTPANNTQLSPGTHTFKWETLKGADRYTLQIATPNFENAIQFILDSTLTKTSFDIKLTSNEYQWRVKAMNLTDETNYTTFNITVSD